MNKLLLSLSLFAFTARAMEIVDEAEDNQSKQVLLCTLKTKHARPLTESLDSGSLEEWEKNEDLTDRDRHILQVLFTLLNTKMGDAHCYPDPSNKKTMIIPLEGMTNTHLASFREEVTRSGLLSANFQIMDKTEAYKSMVQRESQRYQRAKRRAKWNEGYYNVAGILAALSVFEFMALFIAYS